MRTDRTYQGITWIDLETPTEEDVRKITEELDIHPSVANELLIPSAHSKVQSFGHYLYVVLRFPAIHHSHSSDDGVQEVDFIVGKNTVVTARYETVDPLHKFAKVFDVNTTLDRGTVGDHAGILFFHMASKILASLHHELSVLADDLMDIEHGIFSGKERHMVERISSAARETLAFRRAIRLHSSVLDSYKIASIRLFGEEYIPYADILLDEHRRVVASLEDARETLVELRDTNDSLLSTKTNEVMKALTIINAVLLPASFIAWLFALDAVHMPIRGLPYDFWIMCGIMVLASTGVYFSLKVRKWL